MLCCSVSCQDILEGCVRLELFIPQYLTVMLVGLCQSLVLAGGEHLSLGCSKREAVLFNPLAAKGNVKRI